MKRFVFIFILCIMLSGTITAFAADAEGKKPLDEVFPQLVIVPFDYQGKAFRYGEQTNILGEFQIEMRDNRVLVPIRLISDLISDGERWDVNWQPENPNDVVISNPALQKKVRFTVNSKTMYVNGELKTMDVAPLNIQNRIVLPLRSAAEALEKKIDWLDGLILIGDIHADLQHPQTLATKEKIRTILTDSRKPIINTIQTYPLAKYEDDVYYYEEEYHQNSRTHRLFRQTDGQQAEQVQLPGNPIFHFSKMIDDKLYYISVLEKGSELLAFDFATQKTELVSSLGKWQPTEGWLTDIREVDGDWYVILHVGDNTMGSDTLYRIDNQELVEITSAKSFVHFAKRNDSIVYTDFSPMGHFIDNLYHVDLKSGEKKKLGKPGYMYGVNRTLHDGGGASYSGNPSLYILDDYVYTLALEGQDLDDLSAVYRIPLKDRDEGQLKRTPAADAFWIYEKQIYYIDSVTGYLMMVNLDGGHSQIVVERSVSDVNFHQDLIYYLAKDQDSSSGTLYQYSISGEKETKLGNQLFHSLYVGEAGVYAMSNGYEPGIYELKNDKLIHIVQDTIETVKLFKSGIVYQLKYEEGIYSK